MKEWLNIAKILSGMPSGVLDIPVFFMQMK